MQYVLSLSYGKDSIACLGAIKQLGLPLDRIIHAEVWATDTISADLPPMVEFKKKADKWILENYGIEVEHIFARKRSQRERRITYESMFYHITESGKYVGTIKGFPMVRGSWCKKLKMDYINIRKAVLQADSEQQIEDNERFKDIRISDKQISLVQQRVEDERDEIFQKCAKNKAQGKNIVQYLGIASDEPKRIERHEKREGIILPLVKAGWNESYCKQWCAERDMLSPIYTESARGGCWFCHNQGVDQLRKLRNSYPELWKLLMKWDADSPVTFHADGHTVHDFDARFALEDAGLISAQDRFRWEMIKPDYCHQLTLGL